MFSSLLNNSDQSSALFKNTELSNTGPLFGFSPAPTETELKIDEPKEKPVPDTVFQKMLYSDITFLVDGQEFQAHKVILAARCKFFEDLFTSEMEEPNDNKLIKLDDISQKAFLIVLKFIYGEELDLTEDPALELLPLVETKYSLPKLREKLEDFIAGIVKLVNYVRIINLAESLKNKKIRNAVLDFMGDKIDVITKREDIMDVSKEILVKLLSRATFGKTNISISNDKSAVSVNKPRRKIS